MKLNTIDETFEVWKKIKTKYVSAIVWIRRGEDYFVFGDDMIIMNQITSVETITNEHNKRHCHFPFYKLDTFLSALVRAGHRVAVCDQLE
jgi:Mismatch repair ATPase (MutS family)